ncbi:MAG: hypothetical protein D6689_01785 [Deltaproteobacteria bacterium]|nr:MAG: hypothetical protein D6689_01785 [Deltaproteobacteria bacterium]
MAVTARPVAAVALAAALAAPPPAVAQSTAEIDEGAARDLYIRKRPPIPESPRIPKDLLPLIEKKERERDAKRREAIALLERFLAGKPTGKGEADGLFKLAELLWEEARSDYVKAMAQYERRVEACRRRRTCKRPPKEPRLDFSRSEKLYRRLLADHPDYEHTDLVLYLIGFAAREAGRIEEALGYFRRVIDEHPDSPLYGDAWMMVGEHHFALGHWADARDAYQHILDHPESKSYDLALFKTAWCYWKLADTQTAAKLFKQVLDLAAEAERSGTERERRRRAQLRDEALDYLVLVFTEDESIQPKDVYQFLAEIGGERYSRDVLVRLADLHFAEADYERAKRAYRFLIDLDPAHLHAPKYFRQIVEADVAALDFDAALADMEQLAKRYGPGSDWAEVHKRQRAQVDRAIAANERLLRNIAKNLHAAAQEDERAAKGAVDRELYARAARAYEIYLAHFAESPHAIEMRYLRAEILKFKFGDQERAGDEYLAVAKTAPVGKFHKDALLKAMDSYEKARPKIEPGKRKELLPVDRKFAEAVDLYVKLFPGDDEMVSIVFKNGQLFYDYGDYDEAVKRFGLIVTEFPDHPNAGAAGDRILDALNKSEDYENIEYWARQLKKSKAFASKAEQARLDRIIVEAIGKSGEKYAAGGHYDKAARFYLRIPKEYPNHRLAPQALYNAAVLLEKAKKPEEAARTYLAVAERYPDSDRAEAAAFAAAQVYEDTAYFERAADTYEYVADKFPRGDKGADALYNAGVLRQALGQPRRAIRHYERYAKRYASRKDAEDVAFRVGVVYEEAGDDGRAHRAFLAYVKRYRRGKHVVQALTRAGRTSLKLGHTKRAARELADALAAYKRLSRDARAAATRWAAEARYLQGELVFKQYAAIGLDVRPRKLKRTLDRKSKLLDEAMNVYLDVVEYGDPQWSTAGLYRIGQIFEQFAIAMQQAPTPPELNEQEAQVYRDELDNYVIGIEERAIELYAAGYRKALELGVYNQYTRLLREALSRMARSQYPPENEAREGPRLADVPPDPELIEEVLRDE